MPVLYAPRLVGKASELSGYLTQGYRALGRMLSVEPPGIVAYLVTGEDWADAPRDNARAVLEQQAPKEVRLHPA